MALEDTLTLVQPCNPCFFANWALENPVFSEANSGIVLHVLTSHFDLQTAIATLPFYRRQQIGYQIESLFLSAVARAKSIKSLRIF